MSNVPTRRGFLALTGTGTVASLAGCSQLDSIAQDGSETDDEAVTVAVQPDREELTSLEEEIRTELDNGNISQQEAGQQYQEGQIELTEEAVTSFEESAAETDISIEESMPEYGLLRVAGSDEAIMGALRDGDISGIYPGEQYERFAQQQRQQGQQQQQVQEPSNETDESAAANETDGNETNE